MLSRRSGNVDELELAAEHTAKLELVDSLFKSSEIGNHFSDRVAIVLVQRKLQQIIRVRQTRSQRIQRCNHLLEPRPFLTQGLGTIRLIPDIGLFELALDFGQALRLTVVVKDTSSTP